MQTISYTGLGKLRNRTGHNKTLQILSKEGHMKEDVLPEPGTRIKPQQLDCAGPEDISGEEPTARSCPGGREGERKMS